jgi:hypothetical protein
MCVLRIGRNIKTKKGSKVERRKETKKRKGETEEMDYWDLLFGLYPSSLCFLTTTFQGRFHLMTREEPSLETLWLKHKDNG